MHRNPEQGDASDEIDLSKSMVNESLSFFFSGPQNPEIQHFQLVGGVRREKKGLIYRRRSTFGKNNLYPNLKILIIDKSHG
jgi:hypothetical protein